jgi:small redox-active disulfide protein 2
MLHIKVLGSGCENCRRLEAVARKVVDSLAIEAEVEKVTDYPSILRYGVTSTPGLVIEGKVVSTGRVPGEAEVTTWLTTALSAGRS